jgi:hypothetical protein
LPEHRKVAADGVPGDRSGSLPEHRKVAADGVPGDRSGSTAVRLTSSSWKSTRASTDSTYRVTASDAEVSM